MEDQFTTPPGEKLEDTLKRLCEAHSEGQVQPMQHWAAAAALAMGNAASVIASLKMEAIDRHRRRASDLPPKGGEIV